MNVHPSRMPNNNPVQQMHREGRLPGQRELDFYELMSAANKRYTKLYVAALLANAAVVAGVAYSWYLIRFEPLFSGAAKEGLFTAFRGKGLGGLVAVAGLGTLWSVAVFSWLVNKLRPFPAMASIGPDGLLAAVLPVWGVLGYLAVRNLGDGEGEESWDPCRAPGADRWKQLPCGVVRDKVLWVQMLTVGAAAVAT